jgi:hypothetical protein
MTCAAAREHLSDLLDIRRGEEPTPGTALHDGALRGALEAHVAGCAECRAAMEALAQLGAAYAEFSVGELPEEAFALWGRRAREKAAQAAPQPSARILRPVVRAERTWVSWLATVASSAAAAVLAVMVGLPVMTRFMQPSNTVRFAENTGNKDEVRSGGPAVAEAPGATATPTPALPLRHVDLQPRPTPFAVWTGSGPRSMTFEPGAESAKALLEQLEAELQQRGALMLGESPDPEGARKGLIGLALKAHTRESVPEAPEGLAVVGVLRNSPAQKAGLRPGDYLLKVNDLCFADSTAPEILKFLNAINGLGKGEHVQIDFARWNGTHWLVRRGSAVLGEYDQ